MQFTVTTVPNDTWPHLGDAERVEFGLPSDLVWGYSESAPCAPDRSIVRSDVIYTLPAGAVPGILDSLLRHFEQHEVATPIRVAAWGPWGYSPLANGALRAARQAVPNHPARTWRVSVGVTAFTDSRKVHAVSIYLRPLP